MKSIQVIQVLLFLSLLSTSCNHSNPQEGTPVTPPQEKPGVQSSIEVLFHPTDPTLEKIAGWLREAKQSVDIAMYELDVNDSSPIIKALLEPDVQLRLASKTLSIRFIFEGYGSPEAIKAKMAKLEEIGADVRFATSGKKVHHKFAIIDASSADARLITGSANWSVFSFHNFDENILFMQHTPQAITAFESEFELIWSHSTEFGVTLAHPARTVANAESSNDGLEMHFNSRRHLLKENLPEHNLTLQLVQHINSAKSQLRIATTRVRLVPVLDALRAAAQRGIHIRIVISQDDFHDLANRAAWLLNQPNIELRIKFYNLKPGNFMDYQMHNKFMMVDDDAVLTGSFNWSESSEKSHFENLLVLNKVIAADALAKYADRFEMLWERGRDGLPSFRQELQADLTAKIVPHCAFSPISLANDEVQELLALAPLCTN
jgi:phosphatidylserine/phosphatidylglycerophosphate/cardiolipin synthase-like enzyme